MAQLGSDIKEGLILGDPIPIKYLGGHQLEDLLMFMSINMSLEDSTIQHLEKQNISIDALFVNYPICGPFHSL